MNTVTAPSTVQSLLDGCDRIADRYQGRLARTMLFVLAETAIRKGELLALHTDHLDLDAGVLHVGQGVLRRSFHLSEPLVAALRQYLQQRPGGDQPGWLWLKRNDTRVADQWLRTSIALACTHAGIEDPSICSPRALRRSGAAHVRQAEELLEQVDRILGVTETRSAETNARYLLTGEV